MVLKSMQSRTKNKIKLPKQYVLRVPNKIDKKLEKLKKSKFISKNSIILMILDEALNKK